jgi:hypothetical protein
MRRALLWLCMSATIFLCTGCVTDRYRYNISHAYLSPFARELPRPELEEIVWLVSRAWADHIIGIGHACVEGPGEMHVVVGYTEYRVMIFDLKKEAGHWRIVDHGEGSPSLSTVLYNC